MLRTLKSLEDELVKSFEVLDFKSSDSYYYLKAKAVLIDGSELFIREYNSIDSYLYSYHWQDEGGLLRIRWDNAPHHKDLGTFPDHKHSPDLVESKEMYLDDVLAEIKAELKWSLKA
ncbi:MAG: DUF6516 family protein [Methanothrix sp.]|nr:DUF6516 family protein [Methanothrix sp.]